MSVNQVVFQHMAFGAEAPAHEITRPANRSFDWSAMNSSGLMAGSKNIMDASELDLMNDEELMEGLFGRVEMDFDSDCSSPPQYPACPVELSEFQRLQLRD